MFWILILGFLISMEIKIYGINKHIHNISNNIERIADILEFTINDSKDKPNE